MTEAISAIAKHIAADFAARAGFRRISFVPLQMTHPELVAASFSAFMADRETLQEAFGALDDVVIQVYGNRSGRKFRVAVTPQTAEDVGNTFFNLTNFDFFVENRFLDNTVKDFYHRVRDDCLNMDVDIWQEKIALDTIPAFMVGSVTDSEKLLQTAVRLVRAVPSA